MTSDREGDFAMVMELIAGEFHADDMTEAEREGHLERVADELGIDLGSRTAAVLFGLAKTSAVLTRLGAKWSDQDAGAMLSQHCSCGTQ